MRTLALTAAVVLAGTLVRPTAALAQAPPSLTLAQLITTAEQRNPAIAAARQAVVAADARIALARSGIGPSVTASGSTGTSGTSTGLGTQGFTSSASIGATYVLYDSGQIAHAVRQAEANARAARLSLEATRQDTALSVATNYVGVLRAERDVRVREQVVVQNRELVRLAEGQFRAGVVARADVVRAQAGLAAAEGELLAARNTVDQNRAQLNVAVGQGAATPVAVAEAPPAPRLTLAAGALPALVDERPEVRRAIADIEAAEAGLAVAQTSNGLRVTLDGRVSQGITGSTGTGTTWSVTSTVSLPVSDAGRSNAQVTEATANLEAARARIETARLNVQQQSLQALLNILSAVGRIASARAGLTFAQESFRLAQGRFAAGAGPFLEVIDAQTALVQAEVTLARAEFDELAAVLSLRYALGRSLVDGAI